MDTINSKFLRRLFLTLSLIFPIVLWFTKGQWYKSMSAFAGADNQIYYIGMHLVASWFWLLNASATGRRLDYWVGLGMGLILMIDMYYNQFLHNVFTGATAIMALVTMIYYSSKEGLVGNIILVIIGAISFILGFAFDWFHLFLGEWILMACVAIHMYRKV